MTINNCPLLFTPATIDDAEVLEHDDQELQNIVDMAIGSVIDNRLIGILEHLTLMDALADLYPCLMSRYVYHKHTSKYPTEDPFSIEALTEKAFQDRYGKIETDPGMARLDKKAGNSTRSRKGRKA